MRTSIIAFIAGLLFAVGLGISGMTNPGKVIAFLDFAGAWDPSLAFVMGGALLVNIVAFRLAMRRRAPLFMPTFQLPTRKDIDPRLVGGAALFGVGWGMAGFCPGPGLTSLATLDPSPVVFVVAMSVGMVLYRVLAEPRPKTTPVP